MTDNSWRPAENDYLAALRKYGFDKAAVGIQSAENWHEQYDWNDEIEDKAVEELKRPAGRMEAGPTCSELYTTCARRHGCPVTSIR
jgi:hypothetical protein